MGSEQRSTPVAAAAAGTIAVAEATAGRIEERHEFRTATAAAEPDDIAGPLHQVRFGLLENIAYHAIREQFLSRLNRLFTGVQVFLGTSAIAAMTDLLAFGALWPLVISALAGVTLLVIDPAAGARDHRALRARLHHLLADLDEAAPTLAHVRAGKASAHKVAADAPPAFRCVQAIAYNTAVNAIYPEDDARRHRYRVSLARRALANWLPMRGMPFKKEGG